MYTFIYKTLLVVHLFSFTVTDDLYRVLPMILQMLTPMTLLRLRIERNMTRWLQWQRILRLNMYVFLLF